MFSSLMLRHGNRGGGANKPEKLQVLVRQITISSPTWMWVTQAASVSLVVSYPVRKLLHWLETQGSVKPSEVDANSNFDPAHLSTMVLEINSLRQELVLNGCLLIEHSASQFCFSFQEAAQKKNLAHGLWSWSPSLPLTQVCKLINLPEFQFFHL